MTDFVRVTDTQTGHQLSLPKKQADTDKNRYKPADDRPAVDTNGNPLPTKFNTLKPTAKPAADAKPDTTEAKK